MSQPTFEEYCARVLSPTERENRHAVSRARAIYDRAVKANVACGELQGRPADKIIARIALDSV